MFKIQLSHSQHWFLIRIISLSHTRSMALPPIWAMSYVMESFNAINVPGAGVVKNLGQISQIIVFHVELLYTPTTKCRMYVKLYPLPN